ncbi:hypothetical protein D0Z07_2375 [Hyphodiscus hymeniophilus]|uniref:Vezatin n=1 Tax=Hyphodiscus hymeniophilus TaxID=353542 RepID=A0A9P7AZ24_9HELO|nr:hypothetical protein D0Z07_2375 [Hyphodiscus hymeniophilus]
MESVIFEGSPLAEYLEGEGGEDSHGISSRETEPSSTSSSPSFAPRGKPTLRLNFRHKLPPPLRLAIPQNNAVAAIHNTCSVELHAPQLGKITLAGVAVTASFAFTLAWLIHWTRGGGTSAAGKGRMAMFLALLVGSAMISYAYMRRQWLQYLRQQSLAEISGLVIKSQELDAVVAGALTLVQEVELVSRGYRITPLPPISRLEDRSQTRRCARLRKNVRLCFSEIIPRYNQAYSVLKPFTEQMDLEKYYDIYDISDVDFTEAMLGYSDAEFEDAESLRVLKILTVRFQASRKIFLCCLMALDAHGGKPDFLRWSTAIDEIHGVFSVTGSAEERLRQMLCEEESFPAPQTPKLPLTPGRERWRAQLRKINSLSTGIRGLQAKLHVLREESDNNLNESEDVSELGTNLMIQYESIGMDLKALMQEWEGGKAALASNIDRNERRISSMSGMLSPTISLSGLTAVEEGNSMDALKALNGEARSRSSMDFSSSDTEEVFEAVALPRPRSALTRDERIAKMKETRLKRESMKDKAEANTHMLRELESVINMRPRGRTTPAARVASI